MVRIDKTRMGGILLCRCGGLMDWMGRTAWDRDVIGCFVTWDWEEL